MRGRWELSDAQWQLIEPILRPKRRADGRGRPWQDTRAVLNGGRRGQILADHCAHIPGSSVGA
jgi:transposase